MSTRTRRLFQPTLDSMPLRLAPSALGLPVSAVHVVQLSAAGSIPTAHSMDSGEDSGTTSPIIITPTYPTSPGSPTSPTSPC